METTLVDSNVILDIVTEDPDWLDWSAAALAGQADAGALVINPVVYAEVAARFERIENLEAALPRTTTSARRFRGRRRSWPAVPSCDTAGTAGSGDHRCPISTSARTR